MRMRQASANIGASKMEEPSRTDWPRKGEASHRRGRERDQKTRSDQKGIIDGGKVEHNTLPEVKCLGRGKKGLCDVLGGLVSNRPRDSKTKIGAKV